MESEKNGQIVTFLILVGFFAFAIFAVAKHYFGNEIIGSWFEKPKEYITQYWVYLQPDSKSTKNYRVKGDIEKISLGEDGWGYYLRTVYWNNGGSTSFDDCILEPNGTSCTDISNNSYIVRLGEKNN